MPRFSIVVPAFNAQETLADTLDAVLDQEWDDWECVVVDDGSDDDTPVIAASFAARDARVRVVSQANRGSAGAYNTGVALAEGDYVVLCSADDILLPQHLAGMARAVDVGGYDIYSCNGYYLHPDGSRREVYPPEAIPESLSLADVIGNCFYGVGATYRRELFDAVGGYRVGVFGEDYDFWLRAMAGGARHRYLPEPLSLHRVSPGQKSANLVAAYRSDIRLVSDLRRDFALGPEDVRAVDECIRERERLLAQIARPPRLLTPKRQAAAMSTAAWLLGERRARQLLEQLRSIVGRRVT